MSWKSSKFSNAAAKWRFDVGFAALGPSTRVLVVAVPPRVRRPSATDNIFDCRWAGGTLHESPPWTPYRGSDWRPSWHNQARRRRRRVCVRRCMMCTSRRWHTARRSRATFHRERPLLWLFWSSPLSRGVRRSLPAASYRQRNTADVLSVIPIIASALAI